MIVPTSSTLFELVIHPRQTTTSASTTEPTSSASSTLSTSSTASSTPSTSATVSSVSSSSISSSISSTSVSSSSSSSVSSSSSSSSSSSASASASTTQTPTPSSNRAKVIGGIVGGVLAGLALLTIISVLFTAYRRRRHDARKRPRNSVFLGSSTKSKGGEIDQTQLEAFLAPGLKSSHQHTDSLRSSSVPLLSSHNEEDSTRPNSVTENTTQPRNSEGAGLLPSPYSDHGHGADADDTNVARGSTDGDISGFLPSPYSQHGHGAEDEPKPELSQPPLLAPKPLPAPASRPGSELFAPLAIQQGDFSLAVLEATMVASRPESVTPTSLSRPVDTPGVAPSFPEPVTTPAAPSLVTNSESAASEPAPSNKDAQSSHNSN